MAPRDTGELVQMMDLAMTCDGPVAIRYPRGTGPAEEHQLRHQPFAIGEAEKIAEGEDGCLLAYGAMVYAALDIRRRVAMRTGCTLAVVNARFAKPLDRRMIESCLIRYPFVLSLEEHSVAGGFGAAVAEFVHGGSGDQVDGGRLGLMGLPDRYIDHGERTRQLGDARMDIESLTERVSRRLGGHRRFVRPRRRDGDPESKADEWRSMR